MPWSGLGSLHGFSGWGGGNADTRAGGGRPAAGRGPARAQRERRGSRPSRWRGREAGPQPAGVASSPASGRLHDPESPTLAGPGPELEPGQKGLTGTILDPPAPENPRSKAAEELSPQTPRPPAPRLQLSRGAGSPAQVGIRSQPRPGARRAQRSPPPPATAAAAGLLPPAGAVPAPRGRRLPAPLSPPPDPRLLRSCPGRVFLLWLRPSASAPHPRCGSFLWG